MDKTRRVKLPTLAIGTLARQSLTSRILNTNPSNLIGYWKLDDSSSPSILDSSGNGYHGLYHPISIQNPGFETAGGGGADVFANWSESALTGAIARTTTAGEFRSGVAACKLTAGASADTRVLYNFTCVGGQNYKLFFWTRGDGTNAGRYQIEDITHTTNIIARTSTLVTSTNYTMVEVSFSIPSGCTIARIDLWCPAANGGIAYFDDINLQFPSDFGHVGINGRRCINFTGANNIDVYSSGLISAMGDWTAGTILGYGKIAATQWADGVARYLFRFKTRAATPNNAVTFGKQTTANNLVIQYVDTTVAGGWNINTGGTLDWFSLALTWDAAAGVAKAYYNGVQTGADFGTGTWSGAFDGTRCVIGGENNNDNTQIFIGYGQHFALWKTALSSTQIAHVGRR